MIDYHKQLERIFRDNNVTASIESLPIIQQIKNTAQSNIPIAVYGAGVLGQSCMHTLRQMGIPVAYVLDGNPRKNGTFLDGVQVYATDAAASLSKDCLLLVTPWSCVSYPGQPFATRLFLHQLGYENILFYDVFSSHSSYDAASIDRQACLQVVDLLDDHYSKRLYCTFIACMLQQKEMMHTFTTNEFQYIGEDLYMLDDTDYVVDCGAYNGDTAFRFLDCFPHIHGIAAFEVNPDAIAALQKASVFLQLDDKIDIYPTALYDYNGQMEFVVESNHDQASHLSADAIGTGMTVDVSRLDDISLRHAPTLIKMDIEGAEMNALLGAQNTIKTYKPLMAISIYHKPEDLSVIPLWLKQQCPDYHLFARKYNGNSCDFVLYAIPSHKLI